MFTDCTACHLGDCYRCVGCPCGADGHESPPEPNEALREAAKRAKELIRRV